jgi:alpha,alpha-trehalose phosphorylase
MASWRDAADRMFIPYDDTLGVHPQAESFTKHQRWDFEETKPEQYPLLLHFPYFDLYRKQVVKQADLVFAMFPRGDFFSEEQKVRNFDYYEQLTVRDSSLSAGIQAILAAEVGHMDLAYDYFGEAALIDLEDLEHNTRDGLHIASLASAAGVAIAGFGGARDHGGDYSFRPRLPGALTRIAFRLLFRGRQLEVEVKHEKTTYSLLRGDPLTIRHYDHEFRLEPGKPRERPIPRLAERPAAQQPRGRAPTHRRPPR